MNTESDLPANILKTVIQTGTINYKDVTESLMKLTNSSAGQLFLSLDSKFICKYSSQSKYLANKEYIYEDLPDEQYTIFSTKPVAILCMENAIDLYDLKDSYRTRINDVICLSIIFSQMKQSKYTFTISLCRTLGDIISSVLTSEETSVSTIQEPLTKMISLLNDAEDYVEIDSENIQLEKEVVSMNIFINQVISMTDLRIILNINDHVPKNVYIDTNRVTQILLTIFSKLNSLTSPIHLNVYVENYTTMLETDIYLSFRIFADTAKDNLTIQRCLQAENVTMDTLNTIVAKKLCELMSGQCKIKENGIIFTIKTNRM